MAIRIGIDYEGIEQRQTGSSGLDSVTLRALGKQELKSMIQGEGVLWGADDHLEEGGYRGDPKPDDNSEGEAVALITPDSDLPPAGSLARRPRMEELEQMVGKDILEYALTEAA
jgi:hypothetical protein